MRDVIKALAIVVAVITLIIAVSSMSDHSSHTVDAESNATLADLIQDLADNEVPIGLEFVSPIASQKVWFVPDDITVNGRFAGRRLLGEIGDDYVCIEETGAGRQVTNCIPYSNIASVSFRSR